MMRASVRNPAASLLVAYRESLEQRGQEMENWRQETGHRKLVNLPAFHFRFSVFHFFRFGSNSAGLGVSTLLGPVSCAPALHTHSVFILLALARAVAHSGWCFRKGTGKGNGRGTGLCAKPRAPYRTTSTAQCPCRITRSAVLPMNRCLSPVRPCVAMTMRSTPRSLAVRTISSAGMPCPT